MSTWCDSGLEKIQKMVEGEIFDEILRERADINEEQDNTQVSTGRSANFGSY